MKRLIITGGLLLSACQQAENKADSASVAKADVAAAADEVRFNPGEWRVVTRITAVDMPGMPPAVAKQMTSRETVVTHCVTEEEARRKPEDMFRKTGQGECEYSDFNMAGGTVRATMSCTGGAGGGSTTVEMNGRYGANSYSAKSKLKVTTAEAEGAMTMSAETEGKRIGDCA